MVLFPNLDTDTGLRKLEEYLLTRNFITGYEVSKDDINVFTSFPEPPTSQYVNVFRWYNHIDALLKISKKNSNQGSNVTVLGSDYNTMKKVNELLRTQHSGGMLWAANVPPPYDSNIKKLRIICTIYDDDVLVETIMEKKVNFEPINECLESCKIDAVNKKQPQGWRKASRKVSEFWKSLC